MDDIVKAFIKTTLDTAHKNNWNPGQAANNVIGGVGDMLGGAVNLINPYSKTNPLRVAATNPEQVAPMTKQFIKSVAGSINDTVGQPVNPQTGQLQLQDYMPNKQGVMPAVGRAEQYAYDKPVDVAANLAMGAGTVAKVAKGAGILGKASEAGNVAKVANTVSKTAPEGWASEGMKAAGQLPSVPGMSLVPKTAKEIANSPAKKIATATDGVSDTAANLYLKPFVARGTVGEHIDHIKMAKTMLNDGITGSIQDVGNKVQAILGKTEEMKRRALGTVQAPIDLNEANKIIANSFTHNSIEGNRMAIPEYAGNEAKAAGARTTLQAYMPKNASLNGTVNPLDAYDSMKEIRNLGYDLIDKGKDASNKIINAETVNKGEAYVNVAKAINDQLDSALKNENIFDKVKTPQDIQELQKISPQFAERAAQSGLGWKDYQGLQKGYVDMGQYVRETNRFANTPGAKMTGQITDALTKTVGATGGGLMSGFNPLMVGGGYMLGQIASPFIQAAVEKFMPKIMTGTASTINKIQQSGLPSLTPKVPGLPAIGETALNQPSSLPAEAGGQTAQGGQANSTTPYSLPTQNGIVTTQDYTTQQNALTQQIAQAKATSNTVQQSQLEGQLGQLNNNWNNQKDIREQGIKTNNVVGLGNAAHALIQNADISLLNLNGSFDKLLTSTDPKNAALGKALQSIQNATGINLSTAKTKDALIAGLDQAVAVAQNQYNAQLQQYSGGAKPTVQKPQGLPSPTAQGGLPAIGTPVNYNFDFGSNGEGMPATP